MARDVVPLRLSEAEKAAIAKGAAGLGVTVSEFLRQAALAAAHRLAEARRPKPAPPKPPTIAVAAQTASERRVVREYGSFEEYRNRASLEPVGAFRFDLAQE